MPGLATMQDNELDQLLSYLGQQRYCLTLTTYGLSDEQARRSASASPLSLSGVVKHLTAVEVFWAAIMSGGPLPHEDHEAGFKPTVQETLPSLLVSYGAAAAHTDATARRLGSDHEVAVPQTVPWFPKDIGTWTVRWVLLHLIEETARHAGHADIVRESLDGATAFPLMAAAEDRAPAPWLKPWQPRELEGDRAPDVEAGVRPH